LCDREGVLLENHGLPEGLQRLVGLSQAVPTQKGAGKEETVSPLVTRIGEVAETGWQSSLEMVAFLGEVCLTFWRFAQGKARFRRRDLMWVIQECGVQALPIVSLISVLVGLILAFVGVIQLKMFGAQIYVANLVGIGMAREMGAMMTAVIMAGRTGAAFAAQLGTMTVNEEIDALSTMGISPMEFLVFPRMLALILMMPLLCLYANLMGMVGGAIVGVGMPDVTLVLYYEQTKGAVSLADFGVGLVKSVVFGVIVAGCGCLRGMQCGRSASAVGSVTTSAVVTAIVFIIVSDALITVVCAVIGI